MKEGNEQKTRLSLNGEFTFEDANESGQEFIGSLVSEVDECLFGFLSQSLIVGLKNVGDQSGELIELAHVEMGL